MGETCWGCFRTEAVGWSCCWGQAVEKLLQSQAPRLEKRKRPKPSCSTGRVISSSRREVTALFMATGWQQGQGYIRALHLGTGFPVFAVTPRAVGTCFARAGMQSSPGSKNSHAPAAWHPAECLPAALTLPPLLWYTLPSMGQHPPLQIILLQQPVAAPRLGSVLPAVLGQCQL